MSLRNSCLCLNSLEDEVGGIDLTVRVWIGNANRFALVLEDQNMIDSLAASKIYVLFLPHSQKIFDFADFQFGEREVVPRAITYDSSNAGGWLAAIKAIASPDLRRRIRAHTGVIVIENERSRILSVSLATDPSVPGTQIAIRNKRRQRRVFALDGLAIPRPVLPVRGDDDPFFAERMPTLFPTHTWTPCPAENAQI